MVVGRVGIKGFKGVAGGYGLDANVHPRRTAPQKWNGNKCH